MVSKECVVVVKQTRSCCDTLTDDVGNKVVNCGYPNVPFWQCLCFLIQKPLQACPTSTQVTRMKAPSFFDRDSMHVLSAVEFSDPNYPSSLPSAPLISCHARRRSHRGAMRRCPALREDLPHNARGPRLWLCCGGVGGRSLPRSCGGGGLLLRCCRGGGRGAVSCISWRRRCPVLSCAAGLPSSLTGPRNYTGY